MADGDGRRHIPGTRRAGPHVEEAARVLLLERRRRAHDGLRERDLLERKDNATLHSATTLHLAKQACFEMLKRSAASNHTHTGLAAECGAWAGGEAGGRRAGGGRRLSHHCGVRRQDSTAQLVSVHVIRHRIIRRGGGDAAAHARLELHRLLPEVGAHLPPGHFRPPLGPPHETPASQVVLLDTEQNERVAMLEVEKSNHRGAGGGPATSPSAVPSGKRQQQTYLAKSERSPARTVRSHDTRIHPNLELKNSASAGDKRTRNVLRSVFFSLSFLRFFLARADSPRRPAWRLPCPTLPYLTLPCPTLPYLDLP